MQHLTTPPVAETTEPSARLTEHLGLVYHVANQLARTSSVTQLEMEEIVSAGVQGLHAALEQFDPTRGYAFSTFAVPRIRGAIFDEMRRQDIVPRSYRRKQRVLRAAREKLTRRLLRSPDQAEVAAEMGISVEALSQWEMKVASASPLSLEQLPSGYIEAEGLQEVPAAMIAETGEEIEEQLDLEIEVSALRAALLELNEQERVVLSLYYVEELKMREIAVILEVTESRISQIRSGALQKLRARMGRLREQVA